MWGMRLVGPAQESSQPGIMPAWMEVWEVMSLWVGGGFIRESVLILTAEASVLM